jgi:muconolactone delta-isomerase
MMEGIMRILAMEIETEGVKPEQFRPHLKSEARRVWELYQDGTIRELYFRADRSEAVLILECSDVGEAQEILDSLPLIRAGLIRFEIIPLVPYPGFARLFGE